MTTRQAAVRIVSQKATQIEIADLYSKGKLHCFRFYKDSHVTYNQRICGQVFYHKWQRANTTTFGYKEYLEEAKAEMLSMQKDDDRLFHGE